MVFVNPNMNLTNNNHAGTELYLSSKIVFSLFHEYFLPDKLNFGPNSKNIYHNLQN